MNRFLLLTFLALTFILGSCKKEFTAFKSKSGMKEKFNVQDVDFKYMTARSKVRYQEGNKQVNGNAHIRMRKDSVIWFSVTPSVGLEVTRGMITPDTVLILNRMDKEYYVFTFTEISRYFNFQIDYQLIQNILLGNLPMPVGDDSRIAKENNYYMVKQAHGALNFQSFVNMSNMKVETVLVTEKPSDNFMTMKYSDFEPVNNYLFPFACLINLTYKSEKGPSVTSVNLTHNKIDISDKPLKFPFNIPNKYEAFK